MQDDYYVPSDSTSPNQKFAKGKLVDRIRNGKHKFKLIEQEENRVVEKEGRGEKRKHDELENADLKNSEDYIWLSQHWSTGSWSEIEKKWDNSFALRKKDVYNTKSLSEYLKKWHSIKHEKGRILVSFM